MQILDAILFYNELELLEIRLHELNGVVDRFVVVESTHTFRGDPKPLVFDQYRSRFAHFAGVIDHLVVDDLPVEGDAWQREHHQRNAVERAVVDASDDTVVLVSDADEIPCRGAIEQLRADPRLPAGLVQPVHYGWVDVRAVTPTSHVEWVGTRAMRVGTASPQELRDIQSPDMASVIRPGGWHFSYVGGQDRVAHKLAAYSHSENDTPEIKAAFHDAVRQGRDPFGRSGYTYETVPLSEATHPSYLVRNAEKFEHLVLGAGG